MAFCRGCPVTTVAPPARPVSVRMHARALSYAREDVQWYYTERVARLDLSCSGFEAGDSLVWDERRLGALHDRQIDLAPHVERARLIGARLAQLPSELRAATRDRWQSWGQARAVVASAFALEGEAGTYLGVVLSLRSAAEALEEERAWRKVPPSTVMDLLQQWATSQSRRKVDELRREAVRVYGRALHVYADVVLS